MNSIDENTRKKFELLYPMRGREIIKQTPTNYTETIFELSDGSRIVYDDLDDVIIPIRQRETDYLPEEEWDHEFARRLKKMMYIRSMTQKELANKVGVSENAMSSYINGRRVPKTYMVQRIAETLHCSMEYLTNFDYLL